MIPLLRSLDEKESAELKQIAFNNVLLKAIPDQRKFIRDIKGLVRGNSYRDYFDDQMKYDGVIREKLQNTEIRSKEDLDVFAADNIEITNKLVTSMERAMLRARSQKLKEKPSDNVEKSISLLMDIDTRFFERLNVDEKESLKSELGELIRIAEMFKGQL